MPKYQYKYADYDKRKAFVVERNSVEEVVSEFGWPGDGSIEEVPPSATDPTATESDEKAGDS